MTRDIKLFFLPNRKLQIRMVDTTLLPSHWGRFMNVVIITVYITIVIIIIEYL